MTKLKTLLAAATMLALSSPAAAAVINLSATDFSKSSVTWEFDPGVYTVALTKDLYTAWAPVDTRNQLRWVDYYQYSIDGGAFVSTNTFGRTRFETPDEAFDAWSATGPLQLTFATKTAVTFAIQDLEWQFGDNKGGVSLDVSAVPEPATWGMMALGFLGLGMMLRRKRAQRVVIA